MPDSSPCPLPEDLPTSLEVHNAIVSLMSLNSTSGHPLVTHTTVEQFLRVSRAYGAKKADITLRDVSPRSTPSCTMDKLQGKKQTTM